MSIHTAAQQIAVGRWTAGRTTQQRAGWNSTSGTLIDAGLALCSTGPTSTLLTLFGSSVSQAHEVGGSAADDAQRHQNDSKRTLPPAAEQPVHHAV